MRISRWRTRVLLCWLQLEKSLLGALKQEMSYRQRNLQSEKGVRWTSLIGRMPFTTVQFFCSLLLTIHNKENIWSSVVSCLDNLPIASRETRCGWRGDTGRWLQMIRRTQLSSFPSVQVLLYLAVCPALLTILFFHTVLSSSIKKTCNSFSWRQQNPSGLSSACG